MPISFVDSRRRGNDRQDGGERKLKLTNYLAITVLDDTGSLITTFVFMKILAYPHYVFCYHRHRGFPKSVLCYQ